MRCKIGYSRRSKVLLAVWALAATSLPAQDQQVEASIIEVNSLAIAGQYDLAEAQLRAALEQEHISSDPAGRAMILQLLGSVVQLRGRLSEAESLYRKSLDEWNQVRDSSSPKTIPLINNLAAVNIKLGRLSKAETYAQDSLAISRTRSETHPRDLGVAWNNLAVISERRGNSGKAKELLERALVRWQHHPGKWPLEEASTRSNLGAILRREGSTIRATELLATAATLLDRIHHFHPSLPEVLDNLASVYSDQRQYDRADDVLARAIEIQTGLSGEEDPYVIDLLEARSHVLAKTGRKREAAQLRRRAKKLHERSAARRSIQNVVDVQELRAEWAR